MILNFKQTYIKSIVFLSCLVILKFFLPGEILAIEGNGKKYFDSLQKKLINDGFDEKRIVKLYGSPKVYFEKTGVYLFLKHKESTLNYDQFVSMESIRKAKNYLKKHEAELANAEKDYSVDKRIITAIMLVETQLGTVLGKRSVLNTLSTIASLTDAEVLEKFWDLILKSGKKVYKPSRSNFEKKAYKKSKWAYAELKAFLKYAGREGIEPDGVYGSYAGALGIAQFIPSSILYYAKDGNSDGRISLFNHADAIASIANYLKENGWRSGMGEKQASKVIYRYNHSSYYVDTILKISKLLEG